MLIPTDRPVYRLLADFFGPDDSLYYGPSEAHPEGQVIVWRGEPNEDMEPLNELAREALTAYSDKLDKLHAEKATRDGKGVTVRPRSRFAQLEQAIADEHKGVQALGQQPQVRLMGADKGEGVEVLTDALPSAAAIAEVGNAPRRRGQATLSLNKPT